MRTAEGLVNASGEPAKILVVLKGGDEALKEYTKDEATSGSTSQCFVLTAPGDVISVDITADANMANVFDLEVDGILRASATSKTLAKAFHGTINKVCYKGKSGNKRDGAKYCDATFNRDGTPSLVSSLIIKAWRKEPSADQPRGADEGDEATAKTLKVASYEEYASWQELKHCISKEGPQSPFEISFIDQKPLGKNQKGRMDEIRKRKPTDYSLAATFVFSLQSTASLTALGFEDVPAYTPVPPPAKLQKVKKLPKAKKSEVEGDVDDGDKLEDDGASIIEIAEEEPKKEKEPPTGSEPDRISKSKAESKPNSEPQSESELKAKPKLKAPLPDFGTRKTAIEIVDGLAKSKSKSKSEKDNSESSRKETGKTLNFSRSGVFSTEATAGETENLLLEQIAKEAPASTSSLPQESEHVDNDVVRNSSIIESRHKERGNGEEVERKLKENGDLPDPTRQKCLALQGEKGNPAHRAFLARAETQEPESRAESQADPSEILVDTLAKDQAASLLSELNPETLTMQASEAFDLIDSGVTTTFVDQDLVESPEYEPLTPPVSAKKSLPQGDKETVIANRLIGALTLLRNELPQPSQPLSQASTASTQGESRQSGVPIVNLEHPLNQTIEVIDGSPFQCPGLVRASSPAFSEATEVADPMEIMESVKNSQRTSNGSHEFQYQYSQNLSIRPEDDSIKAAYHTIASPILGSVKASTEDVSMLNIGSIDVREQVREFWKHKSPTPTQSPTRAFTSPKTPKQSHDQHMQNQSFDEARPLPKFQMEQQNPPLIPKIHGVLTGKRKAYAISGIEQAEGEEPRKTVIAPAGRKTESIEDKRLAAEAAIAALEEEQRQLEEEWNAALLIKKKNDEVAALNRKVEELKRTNEERRAEIAALRQRNNF